MRFDLVDLRLIVRIADHNSITQGAKESYISLPAASTRIKNIEASIGTKLLFRTSKGVTLTPPGQTFVFHARQVLSQIEHLHGDMGEYAKGIKGHLRVFSNTSALGEFLPPVLKRYLLTHPDVNIDLKEKLSHDIVRAVSEGQTDIGIIAGNVPTEELEVIPYRTELLTVVVPQGHPCANQSAIAFSDVLGLDFVGLQEGSAIHTFLEHKAEKLLSSLKMRIQVGNFEAVCRMVEANVGVGILPMSAARRHARVMQITPIPLKDEWAKRVQNICVRQLGALPLFAQDLVKLLVSDARLAESRADSKI